MTRDELIHYLNTTIARAADGPPEGPRPRGTFLGNPPRGAVHGLCLEAPDGATFYLAVLQDEAFRNDGAAPATPTSLRAVLTAAEHLLAARRDQMETVEEWADLARAVAALTGRKTADLLTARDLEQAAERPPLPWNEATDGPLPRDDGAGGAGKEG